MFLMMFLMEYKIGVWNIRGINTSEKQNEVMNLVKTEHLKVCAVLETRFKGKKLGKTCDRIFQKWNWESNMQECSKGCRIILGCDFDNTSVQILHQTSQSIFCVISAKNYNFKCFYTFVYASNDSLERRDLWEELIRNCRYVNGKPWCIAGDINVTLYPNEHSSGSSVVTPDMMEFQDCLNKIEVENICKSGLHFTWTKNLQRTKAGNMTGILKKLDRVMSNEEFINQYPKAHDKFLPYIISDHTPSILCITTAFKRKIKAFRFFNFLTDKQEFLPIVREKWSKEVKGFHMYQVVQKMKSLKSPLNNLGWCKGSLFKRVISLRDELKQVQIDIDKDPHNTILRDLEAKLVKEFYVAEADEENFLSQQAKIKWLSEGDKNSSYFHKVLKGRSNKSKILSLTDANGGYYEEDQIPQLFLKHFEEFLGRSYPVQEVEGYETLF
ncbi:RNA-directed DNA polymerase, eukaryota, reverse transcriptase zinc-binding domain protein [Tanacetum coccineum]